MVPARSESHVVGSTVYRDLKSAWSTCVSKPGSPREELRVARAIVPDRCRDVPLLIMNVACYSIRHESGDVLNYLESAALIPDDDVRSFERSEEPISVPEYVQTLVDGVYRRFPKTFAKHCRIPYYGSLLFSPREKMTVDGRQPSSTELTPGIKNRSDSHSVGIRM